MAFLSEGRFGIEGGRGGVESTTIYNSRSNLADYFRGFATESTDNTTHDGVKNTGLVVESSILATARWPYPTAASYLSATKQSKQPSPWLTVHVGAHATVFDLTKFLSRHQANLTYRFHYCTSTVRLWPKPKPVVHCKPWSKCFGKILKCVASSTCTTSSPLASVSKTQLFVSGIHLLFTDTLDVELPPNATVNNYSSGSQYVAFHTFGRFGRASPWWNFGFSNGNGTKGPPAPPSPRGLSSAGSIFFAAPPRPPNDSLLSLASSNATATGCCWRSLLLGACSASARPPWLSSERGKLSGPSW